METEMRDLWTKVLQYKVLNDHRRGELATIYASHETAVQDRDFWKAKYGTLKEVYRKSLQGQDTSIPIAHQIELKMQELAELRTKL
jgi:UDP-glucose 4-epimerase